MLSIACDLQTSNETQFNFFCAIEQIKQARPLCISVCSDWLPETRQERKCLGHNSAV